MMKRNLLSRMLLLFALVVGSVTSVWAEDIVVETIDFTGGKPSVSSYGNSSTWGNWTVVGGANNGGQWAYLRIGGGKSNSSPSTITGTEALTQAVDYIVIDHDGRSNKDFSITSIVVETSSSNEFTTITSTTTVSNPDISSGGTITITPASQIAANSFYKITINWSGSSSKNYGLDTKTIKFYQKAATSSWTVTYNANGATSGTVPTDDTEYDADNNKVTVLGNTGSLAKTGYTFDGWNTKADGSGDDYAAGDNFTISANTTLYAKWEANTWSVTLPNANTYGTYTMDLTNPVAVDAEVTLTYTPASGYENYKATWSVNGTAISGNKFTMPNEAVTVTVDVEEVIDYVTLPFNYNGGTSSDLTSVDGITAYGLGSDYAESNAPYRVKFDGVGDYILIKTDSQPGKVTIGVKMLGGGSTSKITVKGSADGENFTSVQELTISGSQNDVLNLETTNQFAATDRYVKIEFTTKGSNVGVGPISIAKPTTDPEIIVNNKVELTAEDTSGEIAFTINNPVSGTSLTASSEDEWISNVTVDSDNSKVTFTTSANTGAAREGTITLTYGTLTKDVTVSQAAPIVKYAITINSMTNGTIEADVEEAAEGTTVTLTITPADGYSLSTITVTDEDEDEITLSGTGNTRTFTMPASAVTIGAAFEKEHGITYDFAFEVMGSDGWGGSYEKHTKEYTEATVEFSYASKQSGTITDIPAVKGNKTTDTDRYVSITLKDENSVIKAATFGLRHWTNKAITITMYYSTDGGENWTATEYSHAFTSATNGEDVTLTATSLPAGTNAVKIEGGADQQYGVSFAKLDIEKAITISKEYISFCSASALDFSAVEGLEALVVTKVNETSVSTEAVTTVPARVGVILHKDPKAEATSFNVPVVATATAPAKNYLVGVLEDTEIGGNDTDYVLKDGVFKKANAGTLAAGKAYLKTDANAAPALTIGFGDEGTTGIRSIENGQLTIDNVYYDLSGRRVAEPTKGVYIVNGKKVVIK